MNKPHSKNEFRNENLTESGLDTGKIMKTGEKITKFRSYRGIFFTTMSWKNKPEDERISGVKHPILNPPVKERINKGGFKMMLKLEEFTKYLDVEYQKMIDAEAAKLKRLADERVALAKRMALDKIDMANDQEAQTVGGMLSGALDGLNLAN